MPATRVRLLTGILVAAAYVVAARLGFELAFVAEQVTTVWAPTGLAQAALLLWGRRLWPAVYAGAFIANAGSNAPLWTAAFIAAGNTLEAVIAATLLPRGRFDPSLSRLNDVLRFVVIGAGAATTISATIGVTTLCAAAVQPWDRYTALWSAWWIGDALGALVVAPVLLTAMRSVLARPRRDWLTAIGVVAVTMAVTQLVFGGRLGPLFGRGPFHYVLFPLVILAAVRFGQPATSLAVFGASMITIVNTVDGAGPFATTDINHSLILLQAFMGVLAATGLLLAAAITQHQSAERRLGAAHAVGEVLAHAPDLEQAAPAILRGVCGGLGWQFGALWLVADDGPHLQCFAAWSEGESVTSFVEASRGRTLQSGVDLPGRVWASRAPVWIEDMAQHGEFPRTPAARAARLHGGFAFPVCLGNESLGVIECLADRVVAPDPDLLAAMSTIGNQIGQFIGRTRGEESVRDAARRKDEFLAVLAHELRNPLAPIRTGLELVRRAGDDPRAVERVRTMMERQITHMVRLIDDLLDVSRITSGKIHLQRQRTSLAGIVEAAVEANRDAIQAAGVHLDVDLPSQPVMLWVDPTRLVQVISNLLHNATKFSHPDGHVSIRARVTAARDGTNELMVAVIDDGAGIDGSILPHVFELFTQGPVAGGTGLGIGLALARRIVEMHGGRVEARSEGAGHGAEFRFWIPAIPGDAAPESPTTPSVEHRGLFKRRVLIIDDNVDAAQMLALLVRTLGGDARTADDGERGIRAALDFKPAVILLDIGMPGLDGYETCRRLRAALGSAVTIIALTGWGQERDKARAAEAGFNAHLTKPAEPELLERLLTTGAHRV